MIAKDDDGRFTAYAWPGGYPVYHLVDDGECLCTACADAVGHTGAPDDGFRVVASDVNWEDAGLYCAHCNARIESAYGEDGEAGA